MHHAVAEQDALPDKRRRNKAETIMPTTLRTDMTDMLGRIIDQFEQLWFEYGQAFAQ